MRKILKKGFTLAEVLITLAILGVVAAVTLPNMVQDAKYQQMGVKLAKFNSTLENAATAYVISSGKEFSTTNNVNSSQDAIDFVIHGSFMFKEEHGSYMTVKNSNTTPQDIGENYGVFKDGSKVVFYTFIDGMGGTASNISSSQENVTGPASGIAVFYDPDVKGIPAGGQHVFYFMLTTKGFVYPEQSDTCLQAIINNDWKVSPSFYKSNGACMKSSWS